MRADGAEVRLRQSQGDGGKRALRVLIADDDGDSAESLAVLLGLEGHHCTYTTDGDSALRLFGELEPQVVLLDIDMPGSDGHDVARHIRKHSGQRGVLLIAITGWARESDKARSQESGFDAHLNKPVDYERLVDLLRTTP